MKVLIILGSVKAAELPPFGKELLIRLTVRLRLLQELRRVIGYSLFVIIIFR